jgi:hypothetical protein
LAEEKKNIDELNERLNAKVGIHDAKIARLEDEVKEFKQKCAQIQNEKDALQFRLDSVEEKKINENLIAMKSASERHIETNKDYADEKTRMLEDSVAKLKQDLQNSQ